MRAVAELGKQPQVKSDGVHALWLVGGYQLGVSGLVYEYLREVLCFYVLVISKYLLLSIESRNSLDGWFEGVKELLKRLKIVFV